MPYSSTADLPDNVKSRPAKTQRQWMHVWNSAYSACIKGGGAADKCEGEAFSRANGVIKGGEMPDDLTLHQHHEDSGLRLEKADPRVSYGENASLGNCASCRFFDAMCATCALVEGSIDAAWGCKLWMQPLSVQPMATEEEDDLPVAAGYSEPYQIVVQVSEAQIFSLGDLSKPTWIPFLPKPGKFQHPLYGTIEITPAQNQEMVDSVKNHVYQENIPLDAEHETKLSGAVAWLKDMRMNDDDSADAFVEWTDRGRQLIKGGQFKYISPEWFSTWRDPGTGVVHRNVIAGGAITTRPFFKDKVLRALVASEQKAEIINPEEWNEKETRMPEDPKKTASDSPPETVTYTEEQFQAKLAEALAAKEPTPKVEDSQAFVEMQTRLQAAETLAATEKTAREELAKTLTEIKNRERRQRFTAMVSGTGGSNDGGAWVGDADKHLTFLEKLADQFGEEDEVFTSYVEQQNAIAAQFKEADLFKEVGVGTQSGSSDPENKIEQLVAARMASDGSLTHAKAYAEIIETPEGKRLYQESVSPKRGA